MADSRLTEIPYHIDFVCIMCVVLAVGSTYMSLQLDLTGYRVRKAEGIEGTLYSLWLKFELEFDYRLGGTIYWD